MQGAFAFLFPNRINERHTGNTVTLKKSDAGSSRKIKDIKTVNETTQKEESQNVNKCSGDVAEVKDITDEDKELKEEDGFGFEGQEPGRLISKESPNRFFSSRKHFSPSLVPEKESLFSDIIESNNEETQNGENAIAKEEKKQNTDEEKLAVLSNKDLKKT